MFDQAKHDCASDHQKLRQCYPSNLLVGIAVSFEPMFCCQ
jgi:hypothetical protein